MKKLLIKTNSKSPLWVTYIDEFGRAHGEFSIEEGKQEHELKFKMKLEDNDAGRLVVGILEGGKGKVTIEWEAQ